MRYIHRLPFIMGILAAIIAGMLSFKQDIAPRDIYVRMCICLVVFMILGLYARRTLEGIIQEMEEKKNRDMMEALEAQKMTQAQGKAATSTVDYKIDDDYGEDFSPLTVSDIIKGKN